MKRLLLLLTAGLVLNAAVFAADPEKKASKKGSAPAAKATAPSSVIHVVTVSWKAGTTPEQIKAALDGAHRLPAAYKGITRVWTKTIKAQGDRTHAIVMEFASEQALKDYANSEAQKEWYKAYLPIRERSTTFDITN
ncbi:MAG: Dabb family protein [Opitutaceae bacterium]